MTDDATLYNLMLFDPDAHHQPALALHTNVRQDSREQVLHQHRKGQMVLALHGAVMCDVEQAIWLVPPGHAVWIPGGMAHRNRSTDNAQVCFLFIEPGAVPMPERCCTLLIRPVVREMILYLADQKLDYAPDTLTARLVAVLLELLDKEPVEHLHLPMTSNSSLRRMIRAWSEDSADRRTQQQWAEHLGMSERSLARLVKRETGLSFGRWRQQWQLILAMHMLASGASVQQVALDLGYESVTAFITMFKKAMGKPPARYFTHLPHAN